MAVTSPDGQTPTGPADLHELRQEIAKARQELVDGVAIGDRLNDPVRLRLSRRVDRLVVEYIRRSRESAR